MTNSSHAAPSLDSAHVGSILPRTSTKGASNDNPTMCRILHEIYGSCGLIPVDLYDLPVRHFLDYLGAIQKDFPFDCRFLI